MKDYKRLTNTNLDEFNPRYDFCIGCKYRCDYQGCTRQSGSCGNYEQFNETYNRLYEFEDKIEQGILIDGVVMSEVMFDHSRNISGEHPEHIKWVYEVAIPKIEHDFGYKVIVLKSESDYVQEFYHVITRSKVKERNGKYQGFVIAGMCVGNSKLKMQPLRKFYKKQGEHEKIVGIAVDEPKRLARLKDNNRSVLAEFGLSEKDAFVLCKKYDMLSPIYAHSFRNGCWFCPNTRISQFAKLKRDYPQLWNELAKLSKEPNTISKNFKWGKTFDEIERKVDLYNNQISMWEE